MSEVVKCPSCGEEMEAGYVELMEGLRWRTEEKHRGELLRLGPVVWPRKYESYLCRKCRLILFNY